MAKDPGRVLIFDTTLRDGEQSPGASLNLEEKLAIAQQLARLGVDVIEAGFPFASAGDFAAVQRIAQQVGGENGPIICGLARASKADIKACADAVAPAPRGRIHTFIATSDIHLEHKLRKSRKDVLARGRGRLLHAQGARAEQQRERRTVLARIGRARPVRAEDRDRDVAARREARRAGGRELEALHRTVRRPDVPIGAATGRPPAAHRPPTCLLYTSPSPRDRTRSRMPSSA